MAAVPVMSPAACTVKLPELLPLPTLAMLPAKDTPASAVPAHSVRLSRKLKFCALMLPVVALPMTMLLKPSAKLLLK